MQALRDVSFSVEPGTVFGFIGPNGAGKTTLMHVLLGFLDATAGTAFVFGQPVTETIHGVTITDPYRWLEDQNAPATREWLDAQFNHAD